MKQLKITQSVTERTRPVEGYLKDISRIPMLSINDETELFSRIHLGDDEARQELVKANLRFVVSVAKQYQGRGMELCDLINEGNIGLMKAAEKFDPTRGFKFISFAVWWIRQSILEALSNNSRIVRLPMNQVANINKIQGMKIDFLQKYGREPSDEEIAEELKTSSGKIRETLHSYSGYTSLDSPFGEDEDGCLLDVLPDKNTVVTDDGLEKESCRADINNILQVLTERERNIILLNFGLGCQEKSLDEIGQMMNLTRERVRQVREKAIRKLSRSEIKGRLIQYV